jgi:hypothetical protein
MITSLSNEPSDLCKPTKRRLIRQTAIPIQRIFLLPKPTHINIYNSRKQHAQISSPTIKMQGPFRTSVEKAEMGRQMGAVVLTL